MKFATVAAIVSLTVGLSAAQPHGHSHAHFHKRAPAAEDGIAVVYELNGVQIPASEVKEGIKNGTLVIAKDGKVAESAAEHAAKHAGDAAKKAAAKAKNANAADILNVNNNAAPKHHKAAPSVPVPASASVTTNNAGVGVDVDFPDGQLDCSDFPSNFGAVKVDWLNLNGWTGIQQPAAFSLGGLISDITTVVPDMCGEGSCVFDNAFYSYACPAGYQKSQWPLTQGSTGQSVGGIQCRNGKLFLTNPSLSKKLCIPGAEQVKVFVQNTMDELAAICRTDYPGTESETIPLSSTPGSTNPLTCPDGASYYNWQGAQTSAQYYVNPKGIPVSTACQWGSAANPWGNFAPLNLGVGYSNNAAWLSIFQNSPTTDVPLDYDIELVGDNNGFDNMIGRCKYTNGQFCTGDDYSECSATQGCTVNVSSGTATYVFSLRA